MDMDAEWLKAQDKISPPENSLRVRKDLINP